MFHHDGRCNVRQVRLCLMRHNWQQESELILTCVSRSSDIAKIFEKAWKHHTIEVACLWSSEVPPLELPSRTEQRLAAQVLHPALKQNKNSSYCNVRLTEVNTQQSSASLAATMQYYIKQRIVPPIAHLCNAIVEMGESKQANTVYNWDLPIKSRQIATQIIWKRMELLWAYVWRHYHIPAEMWLKEGTLRISA